MKLVSLKLVGKYKSIVGTQEEPFIYKFKEGKLGVSPLCLVGANGSGKSNFIELIADIFCYTERSLNKQYQFSKKLGYDFEVIYWLTRKGKTFKVQLKSGSSLPIIERETRSGFEQVTTHGEYDFEPLDADYAYYLPDAIFAYSSGQNQGLSTVFSKLQFSFYDVLKKQSSFHNRYTNLLASDLVNSESGQLNIEEYIDSTYRKFPYLFHKQRELNFEIPLFEVEPVIPKCLYSDNYLNQLIFISLFIQRKETFSKFLKHLIKIDDVVSFELDLRLNEFRELGFVRAEINRLVSFCSDKSGFNSYTFNGLLKFECNEQFFSSIQSEYSELSDFFKSLIKLTLMSAKRWGNDERRALKESKFVKNVAHVSGGYSPLRVVNTRVKLSTSNGSTLYDRLSDGEHQLIQIIAALILFEDSQTLFILDEPESHFNPEWRMEFVALIEEFVKNHNIELIISTHSPFVLSACEQDRVLLFERADDGGINIRDVGVETYGASFDSLLTSVFKQKVLISKKPLKRIKGILLDYDGGKLNANETLERLEAFGQSFELNYRRNKLIMDCEAEERGER